MIEWERRDDNRSEWFRVGTVTLIKFMNIWKVITRDITPFKTKPSALSFAKRWMKAHPNG